jgi:hypothetical protein
MTLLEAAKRLLEKSPARWRDRGYGLFFCTSCGAQREVDYGDQDTPMTEKREPCSPSCPWRQLEEAIRTSEGGQ